MGIQGYSEHNDKVANHARQVEQEGEDEKKKLNLPYIGHPEEHKLRHYRAVHPIHCFGCQSQHSYFLREE